MIKIKYMEHNYKRYEDAEEFCIANSIDPSFIESNEDGSYSIYSDDEVVNDTTSQYMIVGEGYYRAETHVCIKSNNLYKAEKERIGNPPAKFDSPEEAEYVIDKVLKKKYRYLNPEWKVVKIT